jgi:stress response protein YsnF
MSSNRRTQSEAPAPLLIPLARERLKVGKRRVDVARVIVRTTTEVDPVVVDETLAEDEVRVQRTPVGRFLDQPASPRYDGDVLVIPVMEEVVVVTKRLRLVEEIRIHRRVVRRRHRETVPLRRQRIEVERRPVSGVSARSAGAGRRAS